MKKLISLIFIMTVLINSYCLEKDDFQFDISENVITDVLSSYMKTGKVTDPEVIFKTDSFEFNAVGHLFVFSAKISFRGNIKVVESNKIHINITDYYQSGKKQSKKTAIEKIQDIVSTVNTAASEKKLRITSKYIPSTEFSGIIELDMTKYSFIPALPSLGLKNISINNGFISLASTKQTIHKNESSLQIYVGESLINELVTIFTRPQERELKKISAVSFDIEENSIKSMIFAKNENNRTLWINISYAVKALKDNIVELKIRNTEIEDNSYSEQEIISDIIKLLNQNILNFKSPLPGKKMEFSYTSPDTVNFRLDFDDIIPLPVKPQILGIEAGNDYIGIFSEILD